jgi:hypothetical protein
MLHQFEEYIYPGKFRQAINSILTGGKFKDGPVNKTHIFIINVGMVWLGTIVFNLLTPISLAFPLVVITVTLVNGFVHIAASLKQRKYNPGLVFSIVLNIPTASS